MGETKMKTDSRTQRLAAAAVVGAAYAALTMALAPISYGTVQFRISEVLCILPYFMPFTSWGLFAGCLIANLLTGNIFDIVFGSLATLGAALCTAAIGRRGDRGSIWRCVLACLMPVVWNGLVVGAVLAWGYDGYNIFKYPGVFAGYALSVAGGEAAVLYVLGLPCMKLLPGKKFFDDTVKKYS
jgi:uncharacterized membrane protein